MKKKTDFAKMSYQYAMCLNRQCPQASTYLRQLTEQGVPENIEHWVITSPELSASIKGDCPHYRSSTKVQYTKGFIGILDCIPHRQMQTVVACLMGYLSRRACYRTRKRGRLLSPVERQHILNILKNCGITYPEKFGAHTGDYGW